MSFLVTRAVNAALLASLLTLIPTIQAQQLPGSAAPGQVEKQFERVPIPEFPRRDFLPGQRDLEAPPDAEGLRFRLAAVKFTGVTVMEGSALESASAEFLDREISLADLYTLANRVTAMYRNAGYVLSQALVPAQEIGEDRIATIRVVEGFISNIVIEGVDEPTRVWIRGYLDHIVADKPLTAASLERYMLLVNDLTGVTGRAVLSPSPEVQGAAELRVVTTRDVFTGYAGVTNRGSEFQGPWQVVGQVETNDTIGGYGSFRLFGVSTATNDELHHVTLARSQFIGSNGTQANLSYSHTETTPGGALAALQINTSTDNFELGLQHPFMRSRTRNLTGRIRITAYEGTSERLDVPENGFGDLELRETKDELRSLRVGASYDWVDGHRGVNIVDVELSRGLDILGASDTPSPQRSRPDGEGEYTKMTVYAARVQQIGGAWSLLGSISGQYSANPLLSSEQCGVGGPNYGRAYDQSEIVGDACLTGQLELRYTREPELSWLDNYVAYLFADGGKIYRRAPAAGELARDERKSVGGGVRFRIKRRLSGFLELAAPIDDPVGSKGSKDPRLFLALTGEF